MDYLRRQNNSLYISPNNGTICSMLDYDITLGDLTQMIKDHYPLVASDDIKIIWKGTYLSGNEKKLSDLEVNVNSDKLRVGPASCWPKFK